MTIILIPILISGLASLFLGLLVFLKNRKEKLNQTFFLFTLLVAIWLIGTFLMFSNCNYVKKAIFWDRFIYIGITLLPAAAYQLSALFLKSKFQQKIVPFVYICSFIFLIVSRTDYFLNNLFQYQWGCHAEAQFFHHIFLILFFLLVGISLYNVFRAIKKSQTKTEKIQNKYAFIAFFILSLGLFAFSPAYKVAVYPIVYLSGLVSIIVLTYAILKYHLFEIRVILTELLVIAIGIILFMLPFLMPTSSLKILTEIAFILFFVFGYYLIKATREESKRREEAERLAREFKRLDEAKSQFMLATQHHLRTPLTSIQGYLSMLFEGSWGEINLEAKSKIKAALEATQKLIKLVNEFLDLAKIEVGKEVMAKKETQIEDIFQEVIDDLKLEAGKRRLYLKFEKPQFLPKIMADPGKLKEAIYNVIFNGIKYTLKGGVTVKLEEKKGKSILAAMKDTGIGMKIEETKGLFEKTFERGKEAKKVYTTGRGIGLYLAAQIIKAHQGKIWAESPGPGKGSTFYIELPLKEELKELLEKL